MTHIITLGSTNFAKARLLEWLVGGLGLEPRSVGGLPQAPAETGQTLVENACLKATYYSKAANGLAIASDGGLHIPALGDRWDPLLTHRFVGEGASDQARAVGLLRLMKGLHGNERRAFFVEAVALAHRGSLLGEWEASGEEALIAETMPGDLMPGFWADSLLRYPRTPEGGSFELGSEAYDKRRGDRPVAPTSAWAKLRSPVEDCLRHWM
jgi:inosine/xanthosine triphosphate pyrophosphatase family protein